MVKSTGEIVITVRDKKSGEILLEFESEATTLSYSLPDKMSFYRPGGDTYNFIGTSTMSVKLEAQGFVLPKEEKIPSYDLVEDGICVHSFEPYLGLVEVEEFCSKCGVKNED